MPTSYPGNRRKPQKLQPEAHSYGHQQPQAHSATASLGPPPPLSDLHRWFDFYDRDRGGSLDREEVIAGLVQSFPRLNEQNVREQVYAVWPVFDSDGSGAVDRDEFCRPGGMGRALLAATAGISQGYSQSSSQSASHGQPYVPSAQVATPQPYAPQPYVPTAQPIQGQPYAPQAPQVESHIYGSEPSAPPPPLNPSYVPSEAGSSAPYAPAPYAPAPFVSYHEQPHTLAQTIPTHQSSHQPSQTQTIRVPIPPGMRPGQQIRVRTGSASELTLATIPKRDKWKYPASGQGGAFFEISAPKPAHAPAPAAPMVVQGSYTNHATAGFSQSHHYAPHAQPPSQQPWQPWESFHGHAYQPPPLGMQRADPNEVFPRTAMFSVPASGRKKALLIGINYRGTQAELRGCVNDAQNMKDVLMQQGFCNDPTSMVMLIDEGHDQSNYPTRKNILKGMQWLVQGACPGDILFLHFSGHGAQEPDKSGLEADGYNETILPVDYKTAGQISDDEIWGSVVWPLPSGVRLTALMDCCHSGTGLDLPFEFDLHRSQWVEDVNPAHSKGDVIQFSGCEDDQTSADAGGGGLFSQYQAGGAMTQSFIKAFKENPHATYPQFMAAVHRNLRKRGFSQRPVLTASQSFDFNSRVFSFTEGIESNHNHEIGRIKRKHIKKNKWGSGGGMSANVQAVQALLYEGMGTYAAAGGGKVGAMAVGKLGKKFLKNFK